MRQFAFINKGKNQLILTTPDGSPLIFDYKCAEGIKQDNIILLDDSWEGDITGNHLTRKNVELCCPTVDDLISLTGDDALYRIRFPKFASANGNFIMVEDLLDEIITIITKAKATGEIIVQPFYKFDGIYHNPLYAAVYNAFMAEPESIEELDLQTLITANKLCHYAQRDIDMAIFSHIYIHNTSKRELNSCDTYDKCIIYPSDGLILFIDPLTKRPNTIEISTKCIQFLIENGIIKKVDTKLYQDAVDKYFDLGFGHVSIKCTDIASDIIKRITGDSIHTVLLNVRLWYKDIFGGIGIQSEYATNVHVLEILEYDAITQSFTEEQLEQFRLETKKSIDAANKCYKKILESYPEEEAKNILKECDYKKYLTIPKEE